MAKKSQPLNIHQRKREVTPVSIDDFMNERYKNYALSSAYDRAIPDARDGLKASARKIVFIAVKRLKDKSRTIESFAGYVKAESKYEHGMTSLEGNITTLAQDFKQSIPYLTSLGQIGTFYSPFAGASRYVEITLSDAFELLMKDNDLVNEQWKEGVKVEPEFYLPIVPTVLLNGIQGIAVGVSSKIINRNPIEICDVVIDYLEGYKLQSDLNITPYAKGLLGEWRLVNGIYEHHGFMEVINDCTVEITGLPYSTTYNDYESMLNRLIEEDYILGYTDNSAHGKMQYVIHFNKQKLAKYIAEDSLYHKLKMYCRMERENLTVINFDGQIVRYGNIADLIMNFVDWRLSYYEIRKQKQLADIREKIDWLEDVIKFIELVKSETIVLHKQTSAEVIDILNDNSINNEVLKLPVSKLTTDQQLKHTAEIIELKKLYVEIENSDNRTTYSNDVKELRSKLLAAGYEATDVEHYII
jgi:DNA topoisomerase-2